MKKILFVDDEPNILEGIRRMLFPMRKEWQCKFADGGQAALDGVRPYRAANRVGLGHSPGPMAVPLLPGLLPHEVTVSRDGDSLGAVCDRGAALDRRELLEELVFGDHGSLPRPDGLVGVDSGPCAGVCGVPAPEQQTLQKGDAVKPNGRRLATCGRPS